MTITDVTRRSKYIYFHLMKKGNACLLVSHLGMTGAWFTVQSVDDIPEQKFRNHVHVIFKMDDGGLLVYSDIRRFGEVRLMGCEADYPPLLKMAPEPFAAGACNHFLRWRHSRNMHASRSKKSSWMAMSFQAVAISMRRKRFLR